MVVDTGELETQSVLPAAGVLEISHAVRGEVQSWMNWEVWQRVQIPKEDGYQYGKKEQKSDLNPELYLAPPCSRLDRQLLATPFEDQRTRPYRGFPVLVHGHGATLLSTLRFAPSDGQFADLTSF